MSKFLFGGLALLVAVQMPYGLANTPAVSEQIKGMEKALDKADQKLKLAKASNQMAQVNCLLRKRLFIEGLIRASKRASEGIVQAKVNRDAKTAKTFEGKVGSYYKAVVQLEKSLEECLEDFEKKEAQEVLLVYSEAEAYGLPTTQTYDNPWDLDVFFGAENFPLIPPSSPFR